LGKIERIAAILAAIMKASKMLAVLKKEEDSWQL